MTDLTIDKIREILAKKSVSFIEDCQLNSIDQYMVFKTFAGCYSSDTEILTKNRSWILFKDLTMRDEVACLHRKTKEFYWHKSLAIQKYHYKGEMIKTNHRSVDLLVTPNHNLYIKHYQSQKNYFLCEANKVKINKVQMLNKTNWKGKEYYKFICGNETFILDDFLEFLGWFISDGNVNHTGRSHSIFIKQVKTKNHKGIKDLLNRMKVNWSFYNNNKFYFSSIDLHYYLKKLGKSHQKYIPQEFMNLSRRQLKILFDALVKGDGSVRRNNRISYCTTSKKLADQIQEIIIKLGYNSTLTSRKREPQFFKRDNRFITATKIIYEIGVRNSKYSLLDKKRNHLISESYDDMVYCCTVPEHVILVRRNGRPTWCGNSGKSTSIMKEIDRYGYTWMYFAPFHDVITENLEYSRLRDYDFVHLKGKNQEGVCLAEDFKKYLKMGVSITPFCKTRCPLKDNGCPYYETINKIESYPNSWAGVHSHIPTYLQDFLYEVKYNRKKMYKHFDVIIIDEFPFQVLYNQIVVNRRDIDDLREVVSKMKKSTERVIFNRFLEHLTLASGSIAIDHSSIKELFKKRGLDFRKFSEEYDEMLLDLISGELIKKPPKNLLFPFTIMYKENSKLSKLKYEIYKHKGDGWLRGGIYLTTSNIGYFKNLPLPVIALDATADIRAWNTLLNDYCLWEQIDMRYKNLYQLRTFARYPTSTWARFETFDEMFKRLGKGGVVSLLNIKEKTTNKKLKELLMKRKPRRWSILTKSGLRLSTLVVEICSKKKNSVLLCCNKKIRFLLSNYLKDNYDRDNYEFANYYNLRSRNSFYENSDTCIIIHEPNIPPLQMDIISNVLGWDFYLLKGLMTISETKQGIGRIRQNILTTPDGREREVIEILVFPGALEDEDKIVPEAKLITYRDMFVGKRDTLESQVAELIKKLECTNQKEIQKYLVGVSNNTIRSILIKLYNKSYISNYKRSIEWIYDEKKAKTIKYERQSSGNI